MTDTRRLRVFAGDEVVGDLPVAALVDECPAYDLEPAAPGVPLYPRRRRACSPRTPAREAALLAPARLGQPRLAPLGVRAVRLRSSARARCGGPSRPTPPCSCSTGPEPRPRARRLDRRQRPPRRLRSRTAARSRRCVECAANLACVGRRAARADELPQLRQPGEAAHRLAAHARGGGPRRRLPGARRAGRGRQRVALQRGRRRARSIPTPVVGMVGELPDAARAGRLGFAQPGDAVALIAARSLGAVARPAPSWPSCAARAPAGELPRADLGELRVVHAAVRAGRPLGRAALGARRGRGRPRGRARRVLPGRRARRRARPRRRPGGGRRRAAVRRGPGRLRRSPARATRSRPSAPRPPSSARSAATRSGSPGRTACSPRRSPSSARVHADGLTGLLH